MGKEVSRKSPSTVHQTQTSQAKKSGKISAPLKTASDSTAKFVVTGRGKSLLGAGKPPQITDYAPNKEAKRVAQAVTGSLLPRKKTKNR